MDAKERYEKLKVARGICLSSAESLLTVAERELEKGADPVCFHLALLAFEEVGMSIINTMNYMSETAEANKEGFATDEHIRKIFWALWGGGMIRETKWTKESIEENRHLATTLHERRLETLYTNPKNPIPFEKRVEDGEAKRLVGLVRARLEFEKAHEFTEFEQGDVEEIKWFFSSVEDPEKRKHIFSATSLAKLAELSNGKQWIKWLHEAFQKNEGEMREYAEKELRRKKPEGEEAMAPKYRLRIRIQTPSHSIRNNAFTKWNEGVDMIKIYKSDRKDATKLTKGELLIDFTLPKGLHANYVWEHGLFMSKTTVIALNVATLGVFWWNVQKDISKFYEDLTDLEADPKGGIKLTIAPHKRLHVGFDEAKFVLDEKGMRNVYHVFGLFMREAKMLEEFLKSYSTGLALFSKTDIHLQLEVNAFEEFYKALRSAMIAFGDWDGGTDFKKAVKKQYEKIGEMTDLEKTLDLGLVLEADVTRIKHHPITLTEVVSMKVYCDYYMQLKGKEYYEKIDANGDEITTENQSK